MTDGGIFTPRAAFFDFDMTVADTAAAVVTAMNTFAREKGLRGIGLDDLMNAIGLTMEESWVRYWGRCEPDWPDSYRSRFKDLELSGFRPFPDAIPVLRRLRGEGIRTAIVTNRWLAAEAAEAAGMGGLFDAVVGYEEVGRHKPDPEPVLKAAELLDVAPGEAVMVGDSHVDMMSAVSAGARAIGVTTGGTVAEDLLRAGAWRVCGRLGEVPELMGLGGLGGVGGH
ncbi:MAG: HAD-IA family hydrolase [Deltaproteobacteria bacterium]|jgi:phosphoglycolate phosphatase|nr:HAD-IA family hydrolase [Deltaproteobacteria bacterium]